MIATRPDWCISRQRVWGVPIAVFLCEGCHQPLMDCVLNQRILELFEKEGVEVWHTPAADAVLPADAHCATCGGTAFRRETDILDVWFDSGSSWHAVLEAEPGLAPPADLYFEGGDQYRGWFHTSLLTSVGVGHRNETPFRMVGTAGWTLDEQGRAMSKSLGNGVDPVDIADRLGAEIVRLWVASVDFREDVVNSEHIMQRLADNYRKLRNTFRFLLGNLDGFNPASDAVSDAELLPLDRYMLAKTRELVEKVSGTDGNGGWYGDFQFHRVYHAVNDFCIVDLSSFYLDVLKDRLYTFAPKQSGTPLRTNRPLAHRGGARPARRPHPHLHVRRGLAVPASRVRQTRQRPPGDVFEGGRNRCHRRQVPSGLARVTSYSEIRFCSSWKRCERTRRSGNRSKRRLSIRPPRGPAGFAATS